jgi:hypothetical protein
VRATGRRKLILCALDGDPHGDSCFICSTEQTLVDLRRMLTRAGVTSSQLRPSSSNSVGTSRP